MKKVFGQPCSFVLCGSRDGFLFMLLQFYHTEKLPILEVEIAILILYPLNHSNNIREIKLL